MQEKNDKKLTKEDIIVLNFLKQYKMLKVKDCNLIYKTKKYFRKRVNNLIERGYVKRYKRHIILDTNGRKYLNLIGTSYIKNMDSKSYMERHKYIASVATTTIDTNIVFIPSWDLKEKDKFTEKSRRYIGKLIIEDKDYIVYYISSQKEHVYKKQIIFDIKKLPSNQDVIILVDDINLINKSYLYYAFDKANTYIILNNEENMRLIREYKSINFYDIIQAMYEDELIISDWKYADYYSRDKYILSMPFINTEKLKKIQRYYNINTNENKKLDIITLKENENKIKEILNNKCNIRTFNNELLGGQNIESWELEKGIE